MQATEVLLQSEVFKGLVLETEFYVSSMPSPLHSDIPNCSLHLLSLGVAWLCSVTKDFHAL